MQRLALAVAIAAAADAAIFFLVGGCHRGGRSVGVVAITQGGSTLLALVALQVAFGRGRSMLGRPWQWLWGITLATPALLMAWTLFWRDPELAAPGRIGLRCLGLSLLLGGWPLVLILRLRRETNPVTPGAAGAARGAAIGALAWVLVGLWCPLANVAHLALGHGLPVLVLAALGSWLGTRSWEAATK